jgi:hypothetical protein
MCGPRRASHLGPAGATLHGAQNESWFTDQSARSIMGPPFWMESPMWSWIIIGGIILGMIILMSVGDVGRRGDHTVNSQRWWHKHQ